MDQKDDQRVERRKHIQSAIDWLARAENSIAESKDIKGDLNLMLAKAELQHEEESRSSPSTANFTFKFFSKAGTFLVAGAIAALIVYFPKSDQVSDQNLTTRSENSVAIDAAEDLAPAPPMKKEKIIVHPVQSQPKDTKADEIQAQKIKVEKIDLGTIIEETPKQIEYHEEKSEQQIYSPDSDVEIDSSVQVRELVTSAGMILRSK